MRRRVAVVVLALATGVAALVLVLHTPFVRGRVLRYALATVQEQYGIRIEAARLDYSLTALRVGLAGIRISSTTSPTEPFFQADYVSATLARSALAGDVAFERVSVTNGAVQVLRHRDGTTNLPSSSESPIDPPPLRIALIDVPRLRIDVRDEQGDATLAMPAVAIRLTRDNGRIALLAPADVRAGNRRTRISQLESDATFDGRTLRLTNARLRSDEGSATLNGMLVLIAREATVDVMVAGSADVAALARWAMDEGDPPAGTVAFGGRVIGPMVAPETDLLLTSARLGWRFGEPGVVVSDVIARVHVTTAAARIDELRFGVEGGRVMGTAVVPFDDMDARVAASWTGVDGARLVGMMSPGAALLPAATISGQITASGPAANVDGWVADVRARLVPGLNARNRLSAGGNAHLVLDRGHWRLDGEQRLGGVAPVTISARGRMLNGRDTDSTLDGTVHVGDTPLLALFQALRTTNLADVPGDVISSGTLQADLTLSGRLLDPRIAFDATADNVTVTDAGASGRLTATGTYAVNSEEYTATVNARDWPLVPTIERPLAGRIDAQFTGAGTVDNPRGEGELALREGRWEEIALGDITAHATLDARTAIIDASAPEFSATAAGRVGIDAPYPATIDLRAEPFDLSRILRHIDTPTPITGTTTFTAHVEGPLESWRRGSATVDIASLEATAGELPIRLVEPARLAYMEDLIRIVRLEATAGETRLSASGELPLSDAPPGAPASAVLMTMTGNVGEIARAAAATGLTELPLIGGTGPVALLARVTGSVETPVIAADLEAGPGSVTVEGVPPVSNVLLRAHAEGGWLELREANASYQGANVTATGRAPLSLLTGQPGAGPAGNAELHARATGITPLVLESMVGPTTLEDVTGTIDATLDLASPTLELEDVTGELRLDRLELRAADLPVTQQVPTRIAVRDGLARIEAWDWTGQGATLGVRGQVSLVDRQLAILANGTVDLRMLTPFVRAAGITTAGTLTPRLSITGALDDPRIDGDVTIANGDMRLADPRVLFSDIAARAVLTRNGATIATLTGLVNGGPLTGDGSVGYDPDGALHAELSASVLGMALEFPPGLRSEVNAALTLVLDRPPSPGLRRASAAGQETPAGLISGTATIVRGFYREPLAVVTGLLTSLRTRRLAAAAEPSPLLDALALDVRLVTDEDISVDNNYGRFQIGGDLRVIGTAAVPALAGRAELREGGQLFVGRNTYTVTFGTIDFANPVTIEPDLNIQATTRTSGEEIEVTIRGTPETIAVDLNAPSNPDLGQAEIASLLLTGRRFEDLDPRDAAFVGTQVLGNFSAEVLGFAGRAVGLDTLRLGGVEGAALRRDTTAVATEVDPTTRLTFGKSLGPDVDVTFSQSLRESAAQTWIVDYLPARRLELRLVSDDDDLRSYGFRHDMTFGGGAPGSIQAPFDSAQGRAGESSRVRDLRVATASVTGELVFPDMRIQGLLRLKAGGRFDFGAWQADRDRVEEFYRRSGYLAARVTTSRVETGDQVALTYQVLPGPRTSIAVTGLDVDADLRSRLERAWSDAVVDEFLIDEATGILTEVLAGDGYLQAKVTARVEGDAAAKTLAIAVDRGPLTQRTAIRVTAASRAGAAEGGPAVDIEAFLQARGLVDRAVTDPGAVEREVTAYLRSQGYLRAAVTAGAPLFEEGTAVVPLTVDAGPVFTIASVAFDMGRGGLQASGNALPIETVRETAGVTEGMPFDPSVPETARQRLVALYRREGFPTPAVMVQQDLREGESTVSMTFAITEGPRQVLGEVVVAGNRAIDSDVIVRALDLRLDAPVRAEELLQARTRVFDTRLFRRVDVLPEAMADPPTPSVTPMRLRVTVEEWPALRVRYGVLVAEERPEGKIEGRELVPGLAADLTRRTLFGRAVGIGAALELQRRGQRARGFLNAPTFAGWPLESSLVLEQSRETFAASTFITAAQGLSWEQRSLVARALSLSYSYRFERNHTFDTTPSTGDFPAFDVTINIARLNTAAAWDTRDDPTDTIRGSLFSSSVEYAPEALGSDIRFVRFVSQAYSFRPWRGAVFASAARFGAAAALNEQDLIPSERFFAGGSGTVRGVAEDSLGGRNFLGDPIGGQALLVLNQEVRIPVSRWVRAVGFIDAGNVFDRWRDVRVGDLVGSIGIGVRLATPFALLRADYAKAIWAGTLPRSGRFIFGIGHAF